MQSKVAFGLTLPLCNLISTFLIHDICFMDWRNCIGESVLTIVKFLEA